MFKKNKVICWILVIIWLSVIFIFSNMNANESNDESKGFISNIIKVGIGITNKLGITDNSLTEEEANNIIEKLNPPIRKVAHGTEYLVLTVMLICALKITGFTGKKVFMLALLSCFLYACCDEYHQTFVDARTGQFSDVLIDTLGGFIGCIIMYLIYKIKPKLKNGEE